MLDDIKKVLDVSKKGIVVMEDGKPSYVVVPFEDYTRSMKKIFESDYLLDDVEKFNEKSLKKESESYNNNSMDSIHSIIEDELKLSRENTARLRETELKDQFEGNYEVERIKKDLREVKLEDLPF